MVMYFYANAINGKLGTNNFTIYKKKKQKEGDNLYMVPFHFLVFTFLEPTQKAVARRASHGKRKIDRA